MSEVYAPGQAMVLTSFFSRPPKWFIVAGPANADEAQTVKALFPKCVCLGVEPSEAMVRWQLAHGFPGELVPMGLADAAGLREIVIPPKQENRSSMVRPCGGGTHKVATTTLDALDLVHGPFERAVLWADIEGMELPMLRGAEECFARGAFDLVNIEVMPDERPDDVPEFEAFFKRHGLALAHEWDWQCSRRNQIWRKVG